jgi:hypothetical protein
MRRLAAHDRTRRERPDRSGKGLPIEIVERVLQHRIAAFLTDTLRRVGAGSQPRAAQTILAT